MGYRYIGSKNKILPQIMEKIGSIISPEMHVIDIMAGTGAVALELRKNGYKVTACDLMTFSYHHCIVALMFTEEPKFHKLKELTSKNNQKNSTLFPLSTYESIINFLNNLDPINGYFFNEFSSEGKPANGSPPRNYFSPSNAKKIDSIRLMILNLYQQNLINDLEHSLLLHDLIMAANDIANIAGTYGHYLSKMVTRAKEKINMTPSALLIQKDIGKHNVFQGYAEELANQLTCDLCYIDPPYMKRQYAANYHILETIAREDFPEAVGISGLRPWRNQYSNFCSKRRIRQSFTKIILQLNCDNFLISYSDEGLLPINELTQFLNSFGEVSITRFQNKRFKSRNEKSRNEITEYLIHLKKSPKN